MAIIFRVYRPGGSGGDGGGGALVPHPLDYHTDVSYVPSPDLWHTLEYNGESWVPVYSPNVSIERAVFDAEEFVDIHVYSVQEIKKAIILPPGMTILVKWPTASPTEPSVCGVVKVYFDGTEAAYGTDWKFYSSNIAYEYRKSSPERRSFHGEYNHSDGYTYENVDIIIIKSSAIPNEIIVEKYEYLSTEELKWVVYHSQDQLSRWQTIDITNYYPPSYAYSNRAPVQGHMDLAMRNSLKVVKPGKVHFGGFMFHTASVVPSTTGSIPNSLRVTYGPSDQYTVDYVYPNVLKVKAPQGMLIEKWYHARSGGRYLRRPRKVIVGEEYSFRFNAGYQDGPTSGTTMKSMYPMYFRGVSPSGIRATNIIGPFGSKLHVYTDAYSIDPANNKYYFYVPYWPAK